MLLMQDNMRLTEEQHIKLLAIREAAKIRHEKERKAALQRGRVDYPLVPVEFSWAYQEQFRRETS